MKEYILMIKNTFNFTSKASRQEFWMAMLYSSIVTVALSLLVLPFAANFDIAAKAYAGLVSLYDIVFFVPMLSLTVRRLKDVGKSGWWVLIGLLSGIGTLVLIVWLAQPSTFRVNPWFNDYKNNPDEIKLDETVSQTAQQNGTDTNSHTSDSIEKIIADLNELKRNNQISEQEYNEIMSKLTTKK